ncbi:hypothetical protein ACFBZI_11460 [Moraxella sp. ZJ142]|uniref:hypothetical protein n=1 Tax=Moraxella marmotae TaxID=3344520 RepID=UPI0035D43277
MSSTGLLIDLSQEIAGKALFQMRFISEPAGEDGLSLNPRHDPILIGEMGLCPHDFKSVVKQSNTHPGLAPALQELSTPRQSSKSTLKQSKGMNIPAPNPAQLMVFYFYLADVLVSNLSSALSIRTDYDHLSYDGESVKAVGFNTVIRATYDALFRDITQAVQIKQVKAKYHQLYLPANKVDIKVQNRLEGTDKISSALQAHMFLNHYLSHFIAQAFNRINKHINTKIMQETQAMFTELEYLWRDEVAKDADFVAPFTEDGDLFKTVLKKFNKDATLTNADSDNFCYAFAGLPLLSKFEKQVLIQYAPHIKYHLLATQALLSHCQQQSQVSALAKQTLNEFIDTVEEEKRQFFSLQAILSQLPRS